MTVSAAQVGKLQEATARICSNAFGRIVSLGPPQPTRQWDGRSWTRRFEIVGSPPGIPESVISKHFLLGDRHGLDEWAGLDFVASFGEGSSPVPTLYGGDVDLGLIVMEDLGDTGLHGLNVLLQGNDLTRATAMLIEMMIAVARIQIAGYEREEEYRRVRASLPTFTKRDYHAIHFLEENIQRFVMNAESAGYTVPKQAQADLESGLDELRKPDQYLSFSHGDVCPSNAIGQQYHVRLFDLEVSGFRHALLDCFPNMRYLICQEAGQMPAEVQLAMVAAYRGELSNRFSFAVDDEALGRGLAVAATAWLSVLMARLPSVLLRDRRRVMGTDRQRILHGLSEFGLLTSVHDHFPALGDTARALNQRLHMRWPEDKYELAYYPVFQPA